MLATVATFSLALWASSAQADSSVAFTDPCGDVSEEILYTADESVVLPASTGRAPRHDLQRITLDALPAGAVDLSVRVCGPIPAPEYATSNWSVAADIGGNCTAVVDLIDNRADDPVNGRRQASLRRYCTREVTDPIYGTRSETREEYGGALPAGSWSVTGDTIRWRVTASDLLAGGVTARSWTNLRTTTFDGMGYFGFFYGDVGGKGPGVYDAATTTTTFALT